MCEKCKDKKYVISLRDDGKNAIERCDDCQFISDEEAAILAQDDGIMCASIYPCYLKN